MKVYTLTIFFTLLTIYSCNENIIYLNYGDEINPSLNYSKKIQSNFEITNITGEIIDVCPKKGCWMNVKVDDDTVFVKFKDYAFFVPKTGIKGKKVLMSGEIFNDTISVERLRHYAEDANKSRDEIELIIKPEFKINMIARGVAIREN
tara:strand:+ start:1247 stop:1690 length:444 start_codon:yes stop_codon:yes gene_type:complete